MGQENSTLIDDDAPTETLSDRSIEAVAKFINDGAARQIVVMTGAGISTAAGIPDFRSPGTGLYANLARLNLPYPEAVFDIDFFRENPAPFYVLARELYPGKFQPTVSHAFIALLARRKLLRMLFTQNIDCLERAAGVPPELIIEAHGSFATQRCIDCKTPFPDEAMRAAVDGGDPPTCLDGCGEGLVKPDIVFFGEALPSTFHENKTIPAVADLVLVLGTSLSVAPFSSLPRFASEGVPRVLFNMERVGDMGTRADDVLCLGDCDSGVRKLADALGWRDELEEMWTDLVGETEAARQRQSNTDAAARRKKDQEKELDRLVEGVRETLKVSSPSDEEGEPEEETKANLSSGTQGETTTAEEEKPASNSSSLGAHSLTQETTANTETGSKESAHVSTNRGEGLASRDRPVAPGSGRGPGTEGSEKSDTDSKAQGGSPTEGGAEKAVGEGEVTLETEKKDEMEKVKPEDSGGSEGSVS